MRWNTCPASSTSAPTPPQSASQLISQGERPLVRSARVYLLDGDLTGAQVEEIKKYVINPVEAREASLETRETLQMTYAVPQAVATLTGFGQLDEAGLKDFIRDNGLAMDFGDIKFCQDYFRSEQRDPTITEIKMIDTYWSDHCRHTTFGTILDDVRIDDAMVQEAFDRYMALRQQTGRDAKPRCLMDVADHRSQGPQAAGRPQERGRERRDQRLHRQDQMRCGRRGPGLAVPVQERDP